MHKSITLARVTRMVRKAQKDMDYFPGICLNCGKSANNCEPDAENYTCSKCGAHEVTGAENILFRIA